MNAKTEAEAFLRLQEAATKGPWREVDGRDHDDVLGPNDERICDTYGDQAFEPWTYNRQLICAARNTALPKLTLEVVAECERLWKFANDLEAWAKNMRAIQDTQIRRGYAFACDHVLGQLQALQEPTR